MNSTNAPAKVVLPFAAESALKTTIPVLSQIGITPGAASYTDGFPPLTMTPLAAGGIPPSGQDMNGILNALSALNQWYSLGAGFPYDPTAASNANILGYPKGARVMRSDGTGYWLNTVDGNEVNPESVTTGAAASAGWVPDLTNGIASITMTSANVTLTPAQYGKPIITITGALTANLNLIFPSMAGAWIINNACTGGHTVTCKTAAGTGIAVSTGSAVYVFGDSVNIYSAPSSGGSGIPAGIPSLWASDTIPYWALLCDGSFYPRNVYPALYSIIGLAEGDLISSAGTAVTSISSSTDYIGIGTALPTGYVVQFSTTGTMPNGLLAATDYWVRNQVSNTFQVSLTATGPIVNFTTNGTGTLKVLSSSFRTPISEGYAIRIKDNGRGVDLQSASRLARGDGTMGDAVLTIQEDGIKKHNHPMGNGGGAAGGTSLLNYQNWNAAGAPYNAYTLDMAVTGDTLIPADFANVPQALETTMKNKYFNLIISNGY
jgi:hypothetical protein